MRGVTEVPVDSSSNEILSSRAMILKGDTSYETIHRLMFYNICYYFIVDDYLIRFPSLLPWNNIAFKKNVSATSFFSNCTLIRKDEYNYVMYYRFLFNKYLTEIFAKIERTNYIRDNHVQQKLNNYIHLKDALGRLDANAAQLSNTAIILCYPSPL